MGYDAIATEYADHFGAEFATRPVERGFVGAFAELVINHAGRGAPVLDVGCGPGYETARLHELGLDPAGVDVSAGMIAVARERHPHLRFAVGSMLALDAPDGGFAGLTAMYSIIHVADDLLPTAIGEFARVLAPGGYALLIFQTDADTLHLAEAFGKQVDLDYLRHPVDRVTALLGEAGLRVHTSMRREPDETMTAPHAFLIARKA